MPAISTIITRANDILQDTGVRWTEAEMLRWASDGQREIALARPEASVTNASIQMAANTTKQTLPAGAVRLIDIVRNMGAGGSTAGRAIRFVNREILDAQTPDWHTATAAAEIKHFVFDNRDPRTYYVYPQPASALYVEAIYQTSPTDLASAATSIAVPDLFLGALLDYMLYRAYSKDAEYAGNGQRALAHRQAFDAALGTKGSVDVEFGPKANSPINPNNP